MLHSLSMKAYLKVGKNRESNPITTEFKSHWISGQNKSSDLES